MAAEMMDALFNQLVASAGIATAPSETVPDVYVGADGVKRCKSCGGAREHKITSAGDYQGVVVPCICTCMQKKREALIARQKEQEKELRIREFMALGFPEQDVGAYGFDRDKFPDSKHGKAMRAYVKNFSEYRKTGKGLLLYGECGTGKTFYAGCIVKALIDSGRPAMITNFSRLVNQIQARDFKARQSFIDELTGLDLIALDDLGVERDTEYMSEQVETLIDQFYRAGVPMIITSNHSPAWMLKDTDIRRKRMFDRILERCHPIEFAANSMRLKSGRDDYKRMQEQLGL